MARVEIDPNYNSPTFSRATAATDIFKKEDIQSLAAAMSTHVHDGAGKGLLVGAAAAGSITNAQLGPDVARANLLTNGGFEVWQRGNGPFLATGAWTADRWQMSLNGTDTLSVNRDASNVDVASGSRVAAALNFVKGSGSFSNLGQPLKTSENQIRGRTITFSLRCITSVANGVQIGLGMDGTGGVTALSAFHPGDNTYRTLTVSATVPNDATAVYAYVFLAVTGVYILDNAMLVVGSQAATYAPLHPADDLARCLRYYETIAGVASWTITGQAYTTTQFQIGGIFRAIKPVVPTMTVSAPSDLTTTNAGAGGLPVTSVPVFAGSLTGWTLNGVVAAGLVAGNATNLSPATANAKLLAEANP